MTSFRKGVPSTHDSSVIDESGPAQIARRRLHYYDNLFERAGGPTYLECQTVEVDPPRFEGVIYPRFVCKSSSRAGSENMTRLNLLDAAFCILESPHHPRVSGKTLVELMWKKESLRVPVSQPQLPLAGESIRIKR